MLRVGSLIVAVFAALLVTGTPVAAEKAATPVVMSLAVRAVPARVTVGKPAAYVASITYKSGAAPLHNVGVWMILPGPSPVARPNQKTIGLSFVTISMPRSCGLHWLQIHQGIRHGIRAVICNMSGLLPGQTRSVTIKIASRVAGRVLVMSQIWTGKIRTEPGEQLANIDYGKYVQTWITVGRR